MKLREVAAKIEGRVPLSWAEDWDNPGLAVGDVSRDVNSVALSLDATPRTVAAAAAAGCELLVTHHPLIFRPLKSVTNDNLTGRTVFAAIENGVALYAAHTNWDSSWEGVNYILASLLELENVSPLVPSKSDAWGLGAVGDFALPVALAALSSMLKERLRFSNFTLYGEEERAVSRVAIGGGACQDFWREASRARAECFITADISYHCREEALDAGLSLVSADHGEMERASLPALKDIIEAETGLPVVLIEEKSARFFR